jgi:glycosyltransferase involved in cell wall biosynthesis
MRIAHVADFYLPRLGGIEMHVHDLAARQLTRGHVVDVLTSTPAGSPGGVAGIQVHRVTAGLRHPSALHPVAPRLVGELVRRGKYDVVHAHVGVVSPLAWAAIVAAARAGIPVVVTLHSLLAGWEPGYRLSDRLLRWSSLPVQFTAVSEVAAEAVRRLVGPDVLVLPNGIDPSEWRIQPAPRRPEEVLVASVMRLAMRKRALPLLRMLRLARRQLPADVQLRAVIVGDGRQRPLLERYLHRHRMDGWVELPGRLTRGRIRQVFERADLFVAPARLESFGIAALEARCSGLPVLARAGSGVGEFVVPGRDGLLASSDAELIAGLVRLAGDPDERQRMRIHSRCIPADLGWQAVLKRTEAAYVAAERLVQPGTTATVVRAAG